MKTIYKYEFSIENYQTIKMPAGAELLSVQMQKGVPCLWALVDTENPCVDYTLRISGTGHPITENNLHFIDTIQVFDGDLIYHVFQILE